MQTSCGWFFDELTGVEPVLVLRHAARAIELARNLGRDYEDGLVTRLAPARSNLAGRENGADFYRRVVLRARATPGRVAATAAMMQLIGHPPEVPGYTVRFSGRPAAERFVADAEVTEGATGAVATVPVVAERPPRGAVVCRVGEARFELADLFGGQRERALAALEEQAATAGDTRRTALVGVRPLVDQLLVAERPSRRRHSHLSSPGWRSSGGRGRASRPSGWRAVSPRRSRRGSQPCRRPRARRSSCSTSPPRQGYGSTWGRRRYRRSRSSGRTLLADPPWQRCASAWGSLR